MKVFDCTAYFDEELMMDIRFNILNNHVSKFIVVESRYSHSGKKKKLNFNLKRFSEFKHKILYLVIEDEPKNLLEIKNNDTDSAIKRLNSIKRLEQARNYMMEGLKDASEDDIVLLSDSDEIPNLDVCDIKNIGNDIYIFEQKMFNYKFNLYYDLIPWFGTRACKIKNLKSFAWLKDLKIKKYPLWRIDVLFSDLKSNKVKIIKNAGWHFNNLLTAEKLYNKLINQGHHNEFDDSGITLENLKAKIENRLAFYNHKADKKDNDKYNFEYKLKKISDDQLPRYLVENKEKYQKWFD